jgi:serine/threonine protein kinase
VKPGTVVAGYRIESRLGHGGMGIVYEATQLSLNRRVALKILSPQFGTDELFRLRFRREGEIQAAIDHPHIVTVYEAGELDDSLFLAMRLVRGGTLKDMIIARQLEGARTLRLLGPIAAALDTAHEAGLTHRDIKPQNILVGAHEHAYLADFGLTKRDNESALTQPGRFVGSIDYISPEAIRGEPTSRASDIYSLAAVLFECLAGVVPYPRRSDAAVLFAHLNDPPPRLTDQRPKLPGALDDVIARGMAKRPADRHARATDLIRDAERAFGSRVRAVITPPGPVETAAEIGLRDADVPGSSRESPMPARSRPPPIAASWPAPPARSSRRRRPAPPRSPVTWAARPYRRSPMPPRPRRRRCPRWLRRRAARTSAGRWSPRRQA